METYRTFIRTAKNFEEFASAVKNEQETGLSYGEARQLCQDFNMYRTPAQVEAGTKMEFERE